MHLRELELRSNVAQLPRAPELAWLYLERGL